MGLLAWTAACGGEEPAAPEPAQDASEVSEPAPRAEAAPEEPLEFDDPRPRVHNLLQAEVLSTSLVDWLGVVADKFLIRDFEAIVPSLHPGFRGHQPIAAATADPGVSLHGVETWELSPDATPATDAAGWLAGLRERMAPWRRVELFHWSLGQAEFQIQSEERTWGAVDLGLHVVGITQDGGREALYASFRARVALEGGQWRLERLLLKEGELSRIDRPWFSSVARSAGVFHEGIRYGQPGNDTDTWNGVAAGDVDGDGGIDLFVPSSTRSFLYRNARDGTFVDEAEACGLAADVGGTGAIFFDYDGDGDQDLFVAHVGWLELDLKPAGAPLRVYANDGEGRFHDATQEAGIEVWSPIHSLVAFDADGDGWTDLFCCAYGRMDYEHNNSWIEASNGTQNVFLRNRGGRFEDATREAGLDDLRWSYAASACDFDHDGDQDLYVANNFGANRLWRNRGDGRFTDAAPELGVAERGLSMGVEWVDLTGDGRLDLFVTQPSSHAGHRILERLEQRDDVIGPLDILERMAGGNAVYAWDGERFVDRSAQSGLGHSGWAWGSASGDLDLDGTIDIACVNGFVTGDLPQDT